MELSAEWRYSTSSRIWSSELSSWQLQTNWLYTLNKLDHAIGIAFVKFFPNEQNKYATETILFP